MPSPDTRIDQLIDRLGTISVPSLVQFLVSVHREHCPVDLAMRAIEVVSESGYALEFTEASGDS